MNRNRLLNTVFGISVAILCYFPALAADREPLSPPDDQPRELIYCADLMTHEERETYRARMRKADNLQEREALRQAHQKQMRSRARERGIDPIECEPLRYRQRLRGDTP